MSVLKPRRGGGVEGVRVPRSVRGGSWSRRALALLATAAAMLVAGPAASAVAAGFPFEPIVLKHVPVPSGFTRLLEPVFLPDGEHLVLAAAAPGSSTVNQIVLSDVKTGASRCITCSGGPALPDISSVILNPFPDGKRLFLGFHGILECTPSVVDCQSYTYTPYDLTGAEGEIGSVNQGGCDAGRRSARRVRRSVASAGSRGHGRRLAEALARWELHRLLQHPSGWL